MRRGRRRKRGRRGKAREREKVEMYDTNDDIEDQRNFTCTNFVCMESAWLGPKYLTFSTK